MPEKNLYFIAAIPPEALQEKITGLKKDISARFYSARALKVLPHITLKAPFVLPASSHNNLLSWFAHLLLSQTSFTVDLKGFGAFEHKDRPVIFVKPVANDSLMLLQREIIRHFNTAMPELVQPVDKGFHPHMTIAYRDLSPDNFEKAWAEYHDKAFEDLMEINAVHLLQHDGVRWNIIFTRTLVPV